MFLKRLKGFSRSDGKQYQLTHKVFLAFSNIKPIDRLKSDRQDDYNLGLDILNELTRIPKELRRTLRNEYVKSYLKTQDDGEINSRIRYQDRFVPLTLEYMSRMKEFENFRFYTYLGHFVKSGYMKTLIDGSKKERYLTERVCGFYRSVNGISSDYIANRYGIKIKDSNQPGYMLPDSFEPHILRAKPHFIINNNNIGIKLCKNDVLPYFKSDEVKCRIPDFWMSIYELPAMFFMRIFAQNIQMIKIVWKK